MASANIFGQEIEIDSIKAEVVAVNHGWLVTLALISDEGDTLVAFSESRETATLEEATNEMVGSCAAKIREWQDVQRRPVGS